MMMIKEDDDHKDHALGKSFQFFEMVLTISPSITSRSPPPPQIDVYRHTKTPKRTKQERKKKRRERKREGEIQGSVGPCNLQVDGTEYVPVTTPIIYIHFPPPLNAHKPECVT